MKKRIRLSLIERVEGDGDQAHDSDSDHIRVEETGEVNEKRVSREDAFPVFVPKRASAAKRQKKSWAPLNPSSKQILMQFARRAKNTSILDVPESRRDDVLALYNRILASSSRKIDERRFPKAPYTLESYDIATITSNLDKQKKQNALLLKTLNSLSSEAEKEEERAKALEHDAANLQREIELAERSLATLDRSFPREWAVEAQNEEEEAVRQHRERALSMWRRHRRYKPTNKWDDWEEEVNERLMKEKPMRAVIKRMAAVDSALSTLVSNK